MSDPEKRPLHSVPTRAELQETRQRGLPAELQGATIEKITGPTGEPVTDGQGHQVIRLVYRDDFGPEAGDREPRRPIPSTGGAAANFEPPEPPAAA